MREPGGRQVALSIGLSAALVLICFVVFGRTLSHGFVSWDDPDEIFANPAFVPPTWSAVARQWVELPDETHYYKPVTQTVWGTLAAVAYDSRTGQLDPGLFHFGSVLVHGLSAVVVFHLLRRMLAGRAAAAFVGALAFLVHPMQAETVAWASGMKDLLCGLFTLLAVLEWVNASDPNGRRRRWHYAIATACFVLAMLSKPAGVVTPLLAGVAEWYTHRTPLKSLAVRLVPWLAMAAAATGLTKALMPAAVVERPPLWARSLVAGDALAFYLYKLLMPWSLAPDYGRRPATVLSHGWVYIAWIVPAFIAGLCSVLWRRGFQAAAFGFAIFVIAVLPVLGFAATEFQYYSTVADHYVYVGMAGVALVIAAIVARYGNKATAIAAGIAIVWAALAVRQAGYWRDDVTLFTHTVQVNPNSFAGHAQLGYAHWLAGRPEESAAAYREAIRINPDHPNAHDIWIYYARKGDLDAAIREIGEYLRAAEKVPLLRRQMVPRLYNYRGEMRMVLGRLDEATADFEQALAIDPTLTTARENLVRARSAAVTTRPADR